MNVLWNGLIIATRDVNVNMLTPIKISGKNEAKPPPDAFACKN